MYSTGSQRRHDRCQRYYHRRRRRRRHHRRRCHRHKHFVLSPTFKYQRWCRRLPLYDRGDARGHRGLRRGGVRSAAPRHGESQKEGNTGERGWCRPQWASRWGLTFAHVGPLLPFAGSDVGIRPAEPEHLSYLSGWATAHRGLCLLSSKLRVLNTAGCSVY